MRPKLEYACHIWDNCSGKDADLLENFQLDVARIVCGACKGTSHDAISEELCWESLKSPRFATKDKHFTIICNKSAHQYLCELLPSVSVWAFPEEFKEWKWSEGNEGWNWDF